jgi:hypothetical protein
MPCGEWNRLFKDFEIAREQVAPYPMSSNGVPQSFGDVLHAEYLQRALHEKSAALQEHQRTHGCSVTETKK